jgi:hypothetical protein
MALCKTLMMFFALIMGSCKALTINKSQRTAPSIIYDGMVGVSKLLSPKHPDAMDETANSDSSNSHAPTKKSHIVPPSTLPWSASLNPNRDLTYMPMLTHQLSRLKALGFEQVIIVFSFFCRPSSCLFFRANRNPILQYPSITPSCVQTNWAQQIVAKSSLTRTFLLRIQVSLKEETVFRSSSLKPARIGSMEFRNDKFRKVRMTYFDAGDAVQVFNTLWYPNFEYDLPMLGVDLISLGKNRVLSVVDFQPVQPTEEYHQKYNEHLTCIKAK